MPSTGRKWLLGNFSGGRYLGAVAELVTISEAARCDYAANGCSSGNCANQKMFQKLPDNTSATDLRATLNGIECVESSTSHVVSFSDCQACLALFDDRLLADTRSGGHARCPGTLAEGDGLRRKSLKE